MSFLAATSCKESGNPPVKLTRLARPHRQVGTVPTCQANKEPSNPRQCWPVPTIPTFPTHRGMGQFGFLGLCAMGDQRREVLSSKTANLAQTPPDKTKNRAIEKGGGANTPESLESER